MGNRFQNIFRWGKTPPSPPEKRSDPMKGTTKNSWGAAEPSGMSSSLVSLDPLEPPRLSEYDFEVSPESGEIYRANKGDINYTSYPDDLDDLDDADDADLDRSALDPATAAGWVPEHRYEPTPVPVATQTQQSLPVQDAGEAKITPATPATASARVPNAKYKAFPPSPKPSATYSPYPDPAPDASSLGVVNPTSPDGRKLLAKKGVISPAARKPISSIPVSSKPTSPNPVSARPSSSRPVTPKSASPSPLSKKSHPLPPLPAAPTVEDEHAGSSEVFELEAREDARYQSEIAPPLNPDLDLLSTPVRRTPKSLNGVQTLQVPPTLGPGRISSNSLLPPVANDPLSSPRPLFDPEPPSEDKTWALDEVVPTTPAAQERPRTQRATHYDTDRPTCSINLVCYRSGARGCSRKQIQCVLRSRFPDDESFEKMVSANGHLIQTDVEFFEEARRLFEQEMCDFFRRWFSLKSLRAFRVLSYTPTTRPVVVPLDDFVLQEMMYAYYNPDKLSTDNDWIKWVFRLRRQNRRHAIEFVEGWNSTRIGIAGTIPWLSSCIVGIAWTAAGGDVQSAFTVASFILTSSSIILALLAIISSIESSGGGSISSVHSSEGSWL